MGTLFYILNENFLIEPDFLNVPIYYYPDMQFAIFFSARLKNQS
jgi:hypothetical protein